MEEGTLQLRGHSSTTITALELKCSLAKGSQMENQCHVYVPIKSPKHVSTDNLDQALLCCRADPTNSASVWMCNSIPGVYPGDASIKHYSLHPCHNCNSKNMSPDRPKIHGHQNNSNDFKN